MKNKQLLLMLVAIDVLIIASFFISWKLGLSLILFVLILLAINFNKIMEYMNNQDD